MRDQYRHGLHTGFEIHLHPAWVSMYRPAALQGLVGRRVRGLLREGGAWKVEKESSTTHTH